MMGAATDPCGETCVRVEDGVITVTSGRCEPPNAGWFHDEGISRKRRRRGEERLRAQSHRAEMDRNMRGVDDEAALRVEDGAGEVEAFLDVRRDRRATQDFAHLERDRAEAMREQLPRHGRPDGDVAVVPNPRHHESADRIDLEIPRGRNESRPVRFDDEARPRNTVAGCEFGALANLDVRPAPRKSRPGLRDDVHLHQGPHGLLGIGSAASASRTRNATTSSGRGEGAKP
jgi:hypothetical protein